MICKKYLFSVQQLAQSLRSVVLGTAMTSSGSQNRTDDCQEWTSAVILILALPCPFSGLIF